MDALDYEKLLNQLIRLEGDRLDRERLTVLEEDVRAVAQELEQGWPAVTRIDSVRKRVLIHLTFNMEARGSWRCNQRSSTLSPIAGVLH